MIRGVFFDLDDTLIVFAEAQRAGLAAGWRAVFGDRRTIDPAALQRALRDAYMELFGPATPGFAALAGLSRQELGRRIAALVLERLGVREPVDVDRLLAEWAEAERRALRVLPGAVETLRAFRRAGLTTGLITNGASAVQREKLAALALAELFDLVVIDCEVGCAKPDRAIFDHAAGAAGLDAAMLVFVGNSYSLDMPGALAAGWRAVWYNPGGMPLPPGQPPPHHNIRSLPELLTLPEVTVALAPSPAPAGTGA